MHSSQGIYWGLKYTPIYSLYYNHRPEGHGGFHMQCQRVLKWCHFKNLSTGPERALSNLRCGGAILSRAKSLCFCVFVFDSQGQLILAWLVILNWSYIHRTVPKSWATPHFFIFWLENGKYMQWFIKKCANIRGNTVYRTQTELV